MSERLREFTDRGRALAHKGRSLLKPPPIVFGAPRQTSEEAGTSWWHVPVFIQPQAVHRKTLENCTAKLLSLDGGGSALSMCWRRGPAAQPVDVITLAEGELYLVPIAARKETAGRRVAIVTNRSFLAEKKVLRQLPPGVSNWTLIVESADGSQESERPYTLRVPPADRDNGHFTLEVRYAGLE